MMELSTLDAIAVPVIVSVLPLTIHYVSGDAITAVVRQCVLTAVTVRSDATVVVVVV